MKILSVILLLISGFCNAQSPVLYSKSAYSNALTAPNVPPVANAGIDKAITLPTNSTTFFGSATAGTGTALTYLWAQVGSTPSVAVLTGSTTLTCMAGTLIEGTYTFTLTVTDNFSLTSIDTVRVIVNAAANIQPVANAGADSTITLPVNTCTLLGSGTDADGTIVSYLWAKQSGPVDYTITDPTNDTTTITNLSNGTYIFQLTVTDNLGAVGIDFVTITVNPAVGIPANSGGFTFTIDTLSKMSIGIYRQDSILVRTLVSDTTINAGTYTYYWDGRDDNGVIIPNPVPTYQVKIQTNNVAYAWQGTIGNTSDSMTGNAKHVGYYNCMLGLAIASNGYGYFCNGYSEGKPSHAKFNIATPNQRINIYTNPGRIITLSTEYVATDNTNVYWAGRDSYAGNNSMVFATKTSDDSFTTFSSGVAYNVFIGDVTYPSVISFVNSGSGRITGLAVQKTGSYLFVARAAMNQLQVLNKTTGALAQTLTYTTPIGLSVDASDNLWMVTGTTASKYTVNVNGTLSAATLTLSGLLQPKATQVSQDGTTVVVADDSTSQQMKAYNNTTGASVWTLGTAGGYVADATVSNSKFYLHDYQPGDAVRIPFIAFQADGNFWVNDPGNYRVQKYNASRVWQDRIMNLGATYYTFADPNDATRLWMGPLEFEIDYSVQTLTGTAGWTLKKNWGANVTTTYLGNVFYNPTTFSNGRTYALIRRVVGNSSREVVEFPSTGQVRFTGSLRSTPQLIAPDGSIHKLTKGALGGVSVVERFALTGFTGANNPIWNPTSEVLATTPTLTINDPNDVLTGPVLTTTNKVVIWNPDMNLGNAPAYTPYTGYHLGAIQRGQASWIWKTELATHKNYQGEYPLAGWFDIGNGVNNYAGGTLSILRRNIVVSYHGEFWKASQTNKYNHYMDNGLSVGQFGITRPEAVGNAPAMYAGNALTPMVVADPSSANSFYLYHGDESAHSAVHRWKATRLNTIQEQVATIGWPSSYVAPVLTYTNLMTGLPFNDSLTNNVAGWTKSPTYNYQVSTSNMFTVNTSRQSYKKIYDNDVTVIFQSPTSRTNTISRDLGTNNVATNWKVTGFITYPPQNNINGLYAQQFLEVLDGTGKILTSFYVKSTGTQGIYGNTAIISTNVSNLETSTPFEVSIVGGSVTFTFGNFTPVVTTISDGTGNWQTPKTLRLRFERIGTLSPARKQTVGIKNFKFYKDY